MILSTTQLHFGTTTAIVFEAMANNEVTLFDAVLRFIVGAIVFIIACVIVSFESL